MKKIITFSAALILGVCSFGVSRNVRAANATLEDEQVTALKGLMGGYIDTANNNQYTKKTTIFIKEANVDVEYFHAGHTVLERTTYYGLNAVGEKALLMGDLAGGFATINSGYANDGFGNMIHFRTNDGLNCFTDPSKGVSDYSVSGKTMADYFFDLNDLINSIQKGDWGYDNVNKLYYHDISDLTLDANGNYNDTLLQKFQYFAAPMLLQTTKGAEHYLSPNSITIGDGGGCLSICIWANVDSGKLTNTKNDGLLAQALVYKGFRQPGFYITGDFADWELLPANMMGAGNDQNYAISEGFEFSEAGDMKVFHLMDDGYPMWHGKSDDGSEIAVEAYPYNIYMSKDGFVYANEQPSVYSVIGKIGSENWNTHHDMTVTAGVASLSISLAANDEFKIAVNHGWRLSAYGAAALDIQDDDIAVAFGGSDNIRVLYGGNYTISLNISTGKIDVTGTITDPIPNVTVNIYVKKNNENVSWWTDANAYIVAEAVIGGNTVFVEASHVGLIDSGKTQHYRIQVIDLPTTVKMYRCDPSVVTSLPTSAPTSGVWNYTNAGSVGGTADNNWVDCTIQ